MVKLNQKAEKISAELFGNRIATKKELAEILRFSVGTINNLMNRGLPYYKVGRAVRFNLSQVMVWLQRRQMP